MHLFNLTVRPPWLDALHAQVIHATVLTLTGTTRLSISPLEVTAQTTPGIPLHRAIVFA